MSAERMARFLERLGHRVVRTPGAWWYDVGHRFYLSFPHHRLLTPTAADLRPLFRRFPAGVRYFSPAQAPGRPSYALLCTDRDYDLGTLSANSRSKVRRGLARCRVERLDPAWVRAHGRAVNEDTLRRIRLRDPYPWDLYWSAVAQSDCVEVWGAIAGDELVAYLVAVLADRCAELLVARSTSEALRLYPNNALLFTVVRDLMARPSIDSVFFGAESLEAYDGIDDFKMSMGFVRTPIRQQVLLHPVLRPILGNPLAARLVRALAERNPANERWRKLRGVIEFTAPPAPAAGGLTPPRDAQVPVGGPTGADGR